jgi:RNA polymerase sigma factor (sigma-70 family)
MTGMTGSIVVDRFVDTAAGAPSAIIVSGERGDSVTMSFEELYLTQYASMVRLAYTLVDTRPRAEEVVQDAFAAVYERFDRIVDPVAYLRTCVLNNCRRVLRRRMLRRALPIPPQQEAHLEYNHVLDAIRRLPHKQRTMVLLRYDLQMTDVEIASALRIPLGTVKSTMSRAIATLQKEIE